jgi:hypothetical protein
VSDPRIGQYVVAPEHLYGARVERVDHGGTSRVHPEPWLVLDRDHPLDGGRIVVGADYVRLSPVLLLPEVSE